MAYLEEDVRHIFLRRGIDDVAKFWGVLRWNQTFRTDERHTLIGYLVADHVDMVRLITCSNDGLGE